MVIARWRSRWLICSGPLDELERSASGRQRHELPGGRGDRQRGEVLRPARRTVSCP